MVKQKEKAFQPRKVRLTINAAEDIDEITSYIAFVNEQPGNAAKVGDAILETFVRIGQNPLAYKEWEEIPTKTKIYRQAVCLSWLIIYKITSSEIIILGIIHAARKPSIIRKLRKRK